MGKVVSISFSKLLDCDTLFLSKQGYVAQFLEWNAKIWGLVGFPGYRHYSHRGRMFSKLVRRFYGVKTTISCYHREWQQISNGNYKPIVYES